MPFAFILMPEPALHSRHSTPRSRRSTRGTDPRGCCRLQLPSRAEKKTPWSTPGSRCPHPEPSPAPYPLGQLRVHHEVVDVLLCFGELQLPGHHGHHQGCAASALHGNSKDGGDTGTLAGEWIQPCRRSQPCAFPQDWKPLINCSTACPLPTKPMIPTG